MNRKLSEHLVEHLNKLQTIQNPQYTQNYHTR